MWAVTICLRPYSIAYGAVAHRSLYSDSIFKEWVSWVRLPCNVEAGYSLSLNPSGEDPDQGQKPTRFLPWPRALAQSPANKWSQERPGVSLAHSKDQTRKERRRWASGDRVGPSAPVSRAAVPPCPSHSWLQAGGGIWAVRARATAPRTSANPGGQGGARTPSPLSAAHSLWVEHVNYPFSSLTAFKLRVAL